jgi:hypothetical protein
MLVEVNGDRWLEEVLSDGITRMGKHHKTIIKENGS